MNKSGDLFVSNMPQINSYRSDFITFNNMLKKTTLTGKISCLSIAENLFEYMEQTQGKFAELQDSLLDVLVKESVKNCYISLNAMAQMAIDVLIRNLFERTADVGFLATDGDLRAFLLDEFDGELNDIRSRLKEYVAKYSVYDEIVILHKDGTLAVNLNLDNKPNSKNSKFAKNTLEANSDFVEFYGSDSLISFKDRTLLYGAPIKRSFSDDEVIGALVLSFKFEGELDGIFKELISDQKSTFFAIVDEHKSVIATSNSKKLPLSSKISTNNITKMHKSTTLSGKTYLCDSAKTIGYEGYFGQHWEATILKKIDEALSFKLSKDSEIDFEDLKNSSLIHDDLKEIILDAENINEDLSDVVINGEIIASKTRSYSLNPILDNIRNISENINNVCLSSIDELLRSVIESYKKNIKLYATLAIDIMDRNLYERANDCRWWALDSTIREILQGGDFSSPNRNRMSEILEYINGLYTVYTNLFVFDSAGVVQAVSNEGEKSIVGKQLDLSHVSTLFSNTNTQKYFVSPFEKTHLYRDKHTYIYYASILSKDINKRVVGGIGIVFDSEPQFEAILKDSLPKDENGDVIKNSFALFLDKNKRVLSSSTSAIKVGDVLSSLNDDLFAKAQDGKSDITEFDGKKYIIAIKKSSGYREYKKSDGYKNELFSMIFLEIDE